MCGIAGIINLKGRVNGEVLKPMLKAIVHRGPDDEGQLINPHFALGMRRLSIIDLVSGNQPVYNEDKSVFTFFNGEIYNFIELRKELELKGHSFQTLSDTEVLVHAFEEEGISFIKKLNGMFSFILGDLRNNTFYLVRDHFGIKPLYFHQHNGQVIFASELKSIIASGLVDATISEESVVNYFNYSYIPAPKTIFEGINKLEAGHYLKMDGSGIHKKRWYDLNEFVQTSAKSKSTLVEEVRFLLEDAIRLQMRSDVPVGAYLSGGIDSSLIAAMAAAHTAEPISTFSVGFEHSEFDELPYARQVASFFKTNHHELIVSPDDAYNKLPELMQFLDEPIGDSAILPMYLVSKLAADHVKVALSGLGGDELFGGYSRYKPVKNKFDHLKFIPKPILEKVLLPLAQSIQPGWGKQLERLVNPISSASQYHENVKQMNVEMIQQLTGNHKSANFFGQDIMQMFNAYKGSDSINQMMFTDIELYMSDQLLQLTDRMSMASSLEARVPMLDHRLVELAVAIPSALKVSSADTKRILKESIKDLLPPSILNRPKWGFAAPHKTWTLNNSVKNLIDQTVEGNLVRDGVLNKMGVEKFLCNRSLVSKYSTWIWPIIALELWYSTAKK